MERQSGTAQYYPTIAADKTTGLVAAPRDPGRLFKRERNGEGSFVEVPMLESMVAFNLVEHMYGTTSTHRSPRRLPAPAQPLPQAVSHARRLPLRDALHRPALETLLHRGGRAALAEDPRFANISLRTKNIEALYEIADRIIPTPNDGSVARGVRAARDTGVEDEPPGGPAGDEHLVATGFFETIEGPGHGHAAVPGVPVQIDGPAPAGAHGAAPRRTHRKKSSHRSESRHEQRQQSSNWARASTGKTWRGPALSHPPPHDHRGRPGRLHRRDGHAGEDLHRRHADARRHLGAAGAGAA
jgi:crotonobetainyl-CoA:carnitine CoA-transferase CaiB-like acyl-CoA transferase